MANHITKLRKKAGYATAKEAAKELQISCSMMYQIEEGYKKPSSNLGIRISKLFRCSLEDIFLPFITTISDNKAKKEDLS